MTNPAAESQPASPTQPPAGSSSSVTFLPPATPPEEGKAASPVLAVKPGRRPRPARQTPSTSQTSPGANDSAPASGPRDPVTDDRTPTGTRSPASGGGSADRVEFDRSALREVVRGVVLGASTMLHNYLARTETEQREGVWIADQDDQTAIGDPMVNLAARHGGPEMANPDVADLLSAGFALVGYGVKNALRAMQARRGERRLLSAGPGIIEHPPAAE